jgi:dolichol-phosphate mannosyltransferase
MEPRKSIKPRVIFLIPTYNEIENIELLLKSLKKLISKLSKYQSLVLVVDDNSPDGTGELVKRWSRKDKKFILLSGEKCGLGKAMIRGYLYAINKLKADIVISNEADFAFDWKHVPLMLKKINEGYDVVIGSRHVGVGKTEGWTLTRRLNHWVANTFFATWVAGVRQVYDHNGAFRAIRADILRKIPLKDLPARGFSFFFYSLYEMTCVTDKFFEFPVVYKFRTRGESKVSFNSRYIKTYISDIFEYATLAFKVFLKRCNIKI